MLPDPFPTYFLALFVTPNSNIYISGMISFRNTVPGYIHSGVTFLIVIVESYVRGLIINKAKGCI